MFLLPRLAEELELETITFRDTASRFQILEEMFPEGNVLQVSQGLFAVWY